MQLKKWTKAVVLILLCTFISTIYLATIGVAQDPTTKISRNGQSLLDYSTQVIYFINHEKYDQAKEVLNQMATYYLEITNKVDITIEAHNAYTGQLVVVKNELTKNQIDRLIIADEAYKLLIASEVLNSKDTQEFAKQMDTFYQNSVTLLNQLQSNDVQEISKTIKELEINFSTLSCALQIAYPQEYHNQIRSILSYFRISNPAQIKEAKDAVEYLVSTLNILNTHAKETNIQLVYATMNPSSYLIGISAITAIAFITIFWRRWRLVN